jgi:hypothetical protein
MIKEQLPQDHNHTHMRYSRTLWEAFQGRGEMYISEPPLISAEDKPFVLQLCIIGLVSVVVFLLWG